MEGPRGRRYTKCQMERVGIDSKAQNTQGDPVTQVFSLVQSRFSAVVQLVIYIFQGMGPGDKRPHRVAVWKRSDEAGKGKGTVHESLKGVQASMNTLDRLSIGRQSGF